ncbi:MAG: hypothetical protein CMH70_02755 [Nitrosomonadaceae bacterium]|nr:hypothetical protein [Nitrosomonadaceae bacterium]|tara:strand:+ start:125 stop:763 length:639 start_codon:yes stop_codon:yes gene_type:complete
MNRNYLFFIILLTGCSITPQKEKLISVYDFGLQQIADANSKPSKQQQKPTLSLLIAEAKSPVWLNNNTIQYRLAYQNPNQSYKYANSRWAASPAMLLTHHIRNSIAINTNNQIINTQDNIRPDFVLRLELEEFSQIFDAIDSSYVLIKLRANLINRDARTLQAQHNFNIKLTTPTANATGAVRALSESSKNLTKDLSNWLSKELIQTIEKNQ